MSCPPGSDLARAYAWPPSPLSTPATLEAKMPQTDAVEAVAQAIEYADDLTLNPNPRGPIRELRARAAIRETLAQLRTVTPEMVEAWRMQSTLHLTEVNATADWLAMLDAKRKELMDE